MIKRVLLVILALTLVGSGFYIVAQRGLLKKTPLARLNPIGSRISLGFLNNNSQLQSFFSSSQNQARILSSRVSEVGGHTGNVLGTYVQVNEAAKNKEPLQNKAFEYGQYIYCQQVVKEYETKVEEQAVSKATNE